MNRHRRNLVTVGFAGLIVLASGLAVLAAPRVMGAKEAYDKAGRGELILIDIRHPDEWRDTGIGERAVPISMHMGDFGRKFQAATGGDTNRVIALICARGIRSAFIQNVLTKYGYKNVVNVAEGMIGSPAGKGWIKLGLPVKPWRKN